MHWIIQKDIHAKSLNLDLTYALERLGISYTEVDVHHYQTSPVIDCEVINEPIMTNGSIMLSKIAHSNNWFSGLEFNDNFDYKIWSERYSDFLLNKGIISSLADAKPLGDEFFARPVLDNKSFNGTVFTKEKFLAFQQRSVLGDPSVAKPDIEIIVSPKKKIGQEHRHYIVDGCIVSSSRYKFDGTPNFKEGCDQVVLDFVSNVISSWQPSRMFVLDTFIHGDEIGIVEIGFLGHAGIYDADLMKIVHALDSMPVTKKTYKNKI